MIGNNYYVIYTYGTLYTMKNSDCAGISVQVQVDKVVNDLIWQF